MHCLGLRNTGHRGCANVMRRRLVLYLFVLIILAAVAGGAIANWTRWRHARSSDHGEIAEKRFDFGRVAAGKLVSHSFTLDNPTREDVRVTAIKTSCACTTTAEKLQEIPARGSLAIPVEIKTSGRNGPVAETILVSLSDGQRVALKLTGYVEPDTVARIDFGLIEKGDDVSRSFVLRSPPSIALELLDLRYPAQLIGVVPGLGVAEKQALAFEVKPQENIPYGPFHGEIQIITNDEFKPIKTALFAGSVVFPLVVDPERIALGLMAPGQRVTAETWITCPYDRPVTIENVRNIEGEPVEWTLERIAPARQRLIVSATLNVSFKKSVFKSVLGINGAVEGYRDNLRVEIYGIVADDLGMHDQLSMKTGFHFSAQVPTET